MKRVLLLSLFALGLLVSGYSQVFNSVVNAAVPDDESSNMFTITVSGLPSQINTGFGLVEVALNLNHTYDSDVEVKIVSPDGSAFLLFSGIGDEGDNFTDTFFRDEAEYFIYQANPPFSGTFRPTGYVGTANNGQNPNGIWKIVVRDKWSNGETGTLISWSLNFGTNAPAPFPFSSSSLPIIKVKTDGSFIPNDPKILAVIQIINHGEGVLNHVNDTDYEYEGNMMIELQGFSTLLSTKKNYDLDLSDVSGNDIDTTLLGLPSENDWMFKSESTDPTLMYNTFIYEFSRRMGRYAPRTKYFEMVLDGEYQGLYTLTEKIKRDNNRVDIAKLKPEDTTGVELTGGYIIEMNINGDPYAWLSQYLPVNYATSGLPVEFKYVYPKAADIMPQQAGYIKTYVDNFEYSLHQPNFRDPINGYRKWIDEMTFIDFMFVNELSTNYDSYGRSTYLYKEKDTDGGKLKIGPPYDYDQAFCCITDWVWEVTHPHWPYPDWWSIFHTDSLFLQQVHCRWESVRANVWNMQNMYNFLDSTFSTIESSASLNFERWPNLGSPNVAYYVNILKQTIADRLAWMDVNITGADCSTGIITTADQGVRVFPNPATGNVSIDLTGCEGKARVSVYNGSGKCLYENTCECRGLRLIDLSVFSPGIYAIRIITGGTVFLDKLIVY